MLRANAPQVELTGGTSTWLHELMAHSVRRHSTVLRDALRGGGVVVGTVGVGGWGWARCWVLRERTSVPRLRLSQVVLGWFARWAVTGRSNRFCGAAGLFAFGWVGWWVCVGVGAGIVVAGSPVA